MDVVAGGALAFRVCTSRLVGTRLEVVMSENGLAVDRVWGSPEPVIGDPARFPDSWMGLCM